MAKTQSSSPPSPSPLSSSPTTLISNLNEDVLWKVFLRLPNRRSLIQCSIVCKQWHSVIIKTKFTQEFIKQHHKQQCSNSSSYSLPYSISFVPIFDDEDILFGQILSKKSKILLGKQPESSSSSSSSSSSPSGLYRNIWPMDVIIRASCDDLLLISKLFDYKQRYGICNPLTRQLRWLPDVPRSRYRCPESCGFICEPKNVLYRFKVLIYKENYVHENDYQRDGIIFCSETWKWNHLILSFPLELHFLEDFVSSNGILYAPEKLELKGFVAIDLTGNDGNPKQCGFIERPNDFGIGWRPNRDNVCYGVVRGKLRLAQMLFMMNTKEYQLKVWELMEIDNNWVLMHSIRLRREKKTKKFLAAFHPYKENVIFISHNHKICKYEIEKESNKRVCKLRGPQLPSRKDLLENDSRFFNAFTLVYTNSNISKCLEVERHSQLQLFDFCYQFYLF